jgi:hypothetical protein
VYIQRFPELGGKRQISTAGGDRPHWSGDGSKIYYKRTDGKLFEVSVRTAGDQLIPGNPEELFQVTGYGRPMAVAGDDSHFILQKVVDEQQSASWNHVNLISDWFRHPAWRQAGR